VHFLFQELNSVPQTDALTSWATTTI